MPATAPTVTSYANTPLAFLHIHKTGGTSLLQVLRDADPSGYLERRMWHELLATDPEVLGAASIVGGHFSYCAGELFPVMPRFFTFLRDPVDRVISHFRQISNNPHHFQYERIHREGLDLAAFVRDPIGGALLADMQTRVLAQDVDVRTVRATVPPAEWEAEMIRLTRLTRLADDDVTTLPLSIERLRAFEFVGFFEDFDGSVRRMRDHFGWPGNDVPRLNSRPPIDRSSVDPETLATITAANQRDIELYAAAAAQWA